MSNLEELRSELTAPIKSFRIFAIENVLKSGQSPELLKLLESCLILEEDPECNMLLEHAIVQVKARLEKQKKSSVSLDSLEKTFVNSSLKDQLQLINSLKVIQLKKLNAEEIIPALLNAAKDLVVAAEIVKKFRKYWPKSQITFLERNLFSETKSLQISCIETIIMRFPERLRSKLVKLVHINDPVIRALAIRGMAKHFPQLASEFIRECFDKGDYYSKVTALKVCSTIDFMLVKENLISLIIKESEMKIFELCCTVLLANPDKELPFRLISILPKLSKEKANAIKKVLPQYCKVIEMSGLCEDFSAYMAYLNDYPKILNARNLVKNILTSYSEGDDEANLVLFAHLKDKIKNDFVRKAVEEIVGKCHSISLKEKLQKILDGKDDEPVNEQIEEKATVSHERSEKELIRLFAKTRFKKSQEAEQELKKILEQPSSASEKLIASALKASINLGHSDYPEVAKKALKSKNEKLIIAGLEYLATFHKEDFQLLIQKFLKVDSELIRISLIRISSQEFPDYAKFLIKHMLENKSEQIRRNGLGAAVNIDFFHISPLLIEFLEKEKDQSLIEDALTFFIANPAIENVYQLKELEAKNYMFRDSFIKAGNDLKQVLSKIGVANTDEVESFIENKTAEVENLKADIEARKEDQKQLEELKGALEWDSISDTISGSIEGLKVDWKKYAALFVGVFLLLSLISFILNSGEDSGASDDLAMKAIIGEEKKYEVLIEKTFKSAKNKILAKNLKVPGERLILTPPENSYFMVQPGEKLIIIGKPYKRNAKGDIFVKVKDLAWK